MGDQAWTLAGTNTPKYCSMYDQSGNNWTAKTNSTYNHTDGGAWGRAYGWIAGDLAAVTTQYLEKFDTGGDSWITKTAAPTQISFRSYSCPSIGTCGYVPYSGLKYDCVNEVWKAIFKYGSGGTTWGKFEISNKIYVHDVYSKPIKEFDPDTEVWTAKTGTLSRPAGHGGSFSIGLCGYYAGGNGVTTNSEYNQVGDSWSTKTAMPTDVHSWAGFTIAGDDKGYASAGYKGGRVATLYEYDQSGNTWATKTAGRSSGEGGCAFTLDENLPPSAPTSLSVSET